MEGGCEAPGLGKAAPVQPSPPSTAAVPGEAAHPRAMSSEPGRVGKTHNGIVQTLHHVTKLETLPLP